MTPNDLSTVALRRIGAVAASQTPSAPDLLNVYENYLQQMLDLWATQNLTINGIQKFSRAVIAGHNPYTIGSGGDFNQARPIWINAVTITIPGANPADIAVQMLTAEQYATSIVTKTTQAQIAQFGYYDQAFPLGNLNLWPILNDVNCTLNIWVPVALAQFTSQTQVITLMPGYQAAIEWNLAALLLPEWGRADQATVGMILKHASESLGWIKCANMAPSFNKCDPGLLAAGAISTAGGWYTGP